MTKTKNEKKGKRKERNELRKQMRDTLRAFLNDNDNLEENVIDAIKFFAGKAQRESTGSGRTPAYMIVIDKIKESPGMKMSEDDIWNEFKMGRYEMRNAIRKLIKKAEPDEDIPWIILNEENDYQIIEIGKTIPEDWDGPIPDYIGEDIADKASDKYDNGEEPSPEDTTIDL